MWPVSAAFRRLVCRCHTGFDDLSYQGLRAGVKHAFIVACFFFVFVFRFFFFFLCLIYGRYRKYTRRCDVLFFFVVVCKTVSPMLPIYIFFFVLQIPQFYFVAAHQWRNGN